MSKIFMVTLVNFFDINCEALISQLKILARKTDLHVHFFCEQKEPALISHYNKNSLVFSISDDDVYDNCDFLLLPDNCVYNGRVNPEPFCERASRISRFFKEILKRELSAELFIGVSGTTYEEFEEICISVDDLANLITVKANNYEQDPLIHIFLSKQ